MSTTLHCVHYNEHITVIIITIMLLLPNTTKGRLHQPCLSFSRD